MATDTWKHWNVAGNCKLGIKNSSLSRWEPQVGDYIGAFLVFLSRSWYTQCTFKKRYLSLDLHKDWDELYLPSTTLGFFKWDKFIFQLLLSHHHPYTNHLQRDSSAQFWYLSCQLFLLYTQEREAGTSVILFISSKGWHVGSNSTV